MALEKDNAALRAGIEQWQLSAQDWCERAEKAEADAERYRWLRSEEVVTDPRYYDFWDEFTDKWCREERMDAAIDAARGDTK